MAKTWSADNPKAVLMARKRAIIVDAALKIPFVVTDPTWRAYVINYSAGREVVHGWVGGDPARFRRLLTEHVRVSDLL